MTAAISEGYPIATTCRALSYARSSYYARQAPQMITASRSVDEELAAQIKQIITDNPSFGYRRIWAHLNVRMGVKVGRNRVHRIVKIKGWQASSLRRPGSKKGQLQPAGRKRKNIVDPKRKIVVDVPNLRWATDATKIYVEEAGWMNLIPVIDCCSARILSYVFSDRGRAMEAVAALEDAVLARFDSIDMIPKDLVIRTDNGSIFLAQKYQKSLRNLGISQEFTPYHCPSANGVIERWNKTFKEECAWCYTFKTIEEAERVIAEWIHKYNHERMHSRLGYLSPAEYEDALQENAA